MVELELPPGVAEADVCTGMGLSGWGWYPQRQPESPAQFAPLVGCVEAVHIVKGSRGFGGIGLGDGSALVVLTEFCGSATQSAYL